jgi:hypothetical protein
MAGSRTLKLSILGDVDNLNKSLKTATKDVDTFGDKIGKTGKMIGAAFVAAAAAAGAYAVKIGIEGVKAAIEDEKAQTQLALALENATGATTAQIAATEQSILQMSLATGVADDQLRPALGRLVRSTGDAEKAQELLAIALDVSTATGKPLETVAAALSKGFDGNTAALGKLGIGLSAAELKTMTFTDVQGKLTELFGGAAAKNAETYSGRIARMQVAFDEAKETLGFALLPILQKFIDYINKYALPLITAFSDAFSGKENGLGGVISQVGKTIMNVFTPIVNGLVKAFNSVKSAVADNLTEFKVFAGYISKYLAPVIGTVLGGALQIAGKIAAGVIDVIGAVIKSLNFLISGAIAGINGLISAYNFANNIFGGKDIAKVSAPSINVPAVSSPNVSTSVPTIPTITGGGTSTNTASTGGGISTAAKVAATAAAATSSGNYQFGTSGVNTNTLAGIMAASGPTFNLTVNGAMDKEGTARTIVETLNNSYYRGTGGATGLVAI